MTRLVRCWYCGRLSWEIYWAASAADPARPPVPVCAACWAGLPGAVLEMLELVDDDDGAPASMSITGRRAAAPGKRGFQANPAALLFAAAAAVSRLLEHAARITAITAELVMPARGRRRARPRRWPRRA